MINTFLMESMLFFVLLIAHSCWATSIPIGSSTADLSPRQISSCQNTPTSRDCWGAYSIDTNYYDVTPVTGVTREYWLSIENTTCTPDGYKRYCLTFNGTIPGPAIIANWGDNVIIHVTNNLKVNGTSIHWHGVRQLGSVEYDGVPGVTQCPIPPGQSLDYQFQVTQYGSSWYHSHFTLQYNDGLFGPLIFNGPATANYDVDLGSLFLQDWSHESVFPLWFTARAGAPPILPNGLINGTNTFNCSGSTDPNCLGTGVKFETTFVSGTKYLIRLVNVAIEGHFQFSIDGHNLTVIANDFVPIVPFTTESILIGIGQRYDIIVEANAAPGNYWIRSGWQSACMNNDNAAGITGIIRYNPQSTADPTSTGIIVGTDCGDEPATSLVPWLALDVTNIPQVTTEELSFETTSGYFMWTLNTSSLLLNWADPTLLQIFNHETIFPTDYNVVAIEKITTATNEWAVLVIQDNSGIGLFHPIHLHGHDFWVLAQGTGEFESTSVFNLANPPRRDVAILPGNGYIAIAFMKDNPGAWLVHCHIAWHQSEGLAMEFVISESEISISPTNANIFEDQCSLWNAYIPTEKFAEDDSGI